MRAITGENIDDICNFVRKSGSKNANRMPNRWQQISVIVQENLELATLPFHHKWRCTVDLEITGVHDGTLCLMAGRKKHKGKYKTPDAWLKINKSNMAGMIETIKENL